MKQLQNGTIDCCSAQPLLNDYYQITMCYAYWKENKQNERAVFDLFFRKNPFGGEYTVFAGLEDVLHLLQNFHFTESDLEYIRENLDAGSDGIDDFMDYLRHVDCRDIELYAIPEATVVFPRVPLITVVGPLAVCQMLETPLLNLVNYSSLVTTNAVRFRHMANNGVVKHNIKLYEFGLRRAQGPNGGLSASKYCYIGGFDGTSNMLAGKKFGIPIAGTQAHSFIGAFQSPTELTNRLLKPAKGNGPPQDLFELTQQKLHYLMQNIKWSVKESEVNMGERVAFVSYALAFPRKFLALVDTYNVIDSGIINFLAVALALDELGYKAIGCRIDSGDLAYLSKVARKLFCAVADLDPARYAWIPHLTLIASNDINEETIGSLNKQGHSIDVFAIGTHLVTCQRQPALGCVYKLVELNNVPRIKLSQDIVKVNIPGHKKSFRLYGKEDKYILDLMMSMDEPDPVPGRRILCLHPFEAAMRAYVTPMRVDRLQRCFWRDGTLQEELPSLKDLRDRLRESVKSMREDHLRTLNPTPYKVSISETLHQFFHNLWLKNAPIGEIE